MIDQGVMPTPPAPVVRPPIQVSISYYEVACDTIDRLTLYCPSVHS